MADLLDDADIKLLKNYDEYYFDMEELLQNLPKTQTDFDPTDLGGEGCKDLTGMDGQGKDNKRPATVASSSSRSSGDCQQSSVTAPRDSQEIKPALTGYQGAMVILSDFEPSTTVWTKEELAALGLASPPPSSINIDAKLESPTKRRRS